VHTEGEFLYVRNYNVKRGFIMSLQTFSTSNENDLQKKEIELTNQGFQNSPDERLSSGEYRVFTEVNPDTQERIYVVEWMDFEYTDQPERY
jgi:hypothetical protein